MKRRGFLGLIGGAAVAGPGMVKNAAAQSIADLGVGSGLGDVSGLAGGWSAPVDGSGTISTQGEWAARNLRKIGLRTAEQHAFHKRRTAVHTLDPDLASLRSPALHWRIAQQRERQYWRDLGHERGWLEARIAGWLDDF